MFRALKELKSSWGDKNIYMQVTVQCIMMCANYCTHRYTLCAL